ncbi:sensor histidine kinase [Prochlorococcus marinus]|uniref:sensor histidine kinase n=1 Tax=Prochlorococcus marinus TaxID=1219 RepID=UPI0022B5D095|nr:HAMP domain-containing sensor histidine kinase [Prochlorococcus marinus]
MSSMQYSERFLNFVQQQLMSFQANQELEHVVVYVARSGDSGSPSLEVVGQWPKSEKVLQPVETDTALRTPSSNRRWYPLQEGSILLGVIRAERIASEEEEWSESLDQRLQSISILLANSLASELDRKRLLEQLDDQKEQISLMVHQLRNPLAALGTYAKLLLKKIGPESEHKNLVKGLMTEQAQVNKYLYALDQLSQVKLPQADDGSNRLLLPPLLPTETSISVKSLIEPLIERAKARANLQGRKWFGPSKWPKWMESRSISEGVIAEIVANLLENAFRYSPPQSSIGIEVIEEGICIWDEGIPIKQEEREMIFEKGFRGESGSKMSGSGIGLALARDLARQLGGDLKLFVNPSQFKNSLPESGNAFVFTLEPK